LTHRCVTTNHSNTRVAVFTGFLHGSQQQHLCACAFRLAKFVCAGLSCFPAKDLRACVVTAPMLRCAYLNPLLSSLAHTECVTTRVFLSFGVHCQTWQCHARFCKLAQLPAVETLDPACLLGVCLPDVYSVSRSSLPAMSDLISHPPIFVASQFQLS
jgi:hypothetical protein